MSAWVSDQATVSAALLARVPQESTQSVGVIGISGIEKTLQDSGLRPFVTRLAARDGGGVELALEGVEFRSLSDWLDAVEPGWGYTLQSFRFEASDTPGTILAEFQLGVEQ